MRISEQVRALRRDRGMTWRELAEAAGVSLKSIQRAECDEKISKEMMRKLNVVLKDLVIPEWLPESAGYHRLWDEDEDEDKDEGWMDIREAFVMLAKAWKFKPGKKYVINGKKMRFLRKVGANHLFQSGAGWLASWTDAQLVGVDVECGTS